MENSTSRDTPCYYDDRHGPVEGFLLADITRRMRGAFQDRLDGSDLTLSQARALKLIAMNPGVQQKALAQMLEIQPMTIAKLLDNLELRGLVRRDKDPADRRAHLINLTADAEPVLKTIKVTIEALREEMLQDLSEQQRAQFVDVLTLIRERLMSMSF